MVVFHHGFVSNISRFARPYNVCLCPYITDPLNKLTVWVENTSWWGNPMIEVATNGEWYQDTGMASILPTTGFIILPFNTLSTI